MTDIPSMIDILEALLVQVLKDTYHPDKWDSLVINKRKPWTYRIFQQIGPYRVCLHVFDECNQDECFLHPHPWPGAFLVLRGGYWHTVGMSPNLTDDPILGFRHLLRPHNSYEITDRRVWHSVQPMMRTWTVMVNGEPWQDSHAKTRTTKGKDLVKLNYHEKVERLCEFHSLISLYLRSTRPAPSFWQQMKNVFTRNK